MKTHYVIIASGLAAAILGVGITWADFGRTPAFEVGSGAVASAPNAGDQLPKLVVDSRVHDFGTVERNTTVKHAFRITNVGNGELTLKAGATSCAACTIAELSKTQVPPGESAEVVVEYKADTHKSEFRQIAAVLTNDRSQPRIELSVVGRVSGKFHIIPAQLILSNVSASEPYRSNVRIFCYLADDMRVVSHALSEAKTAEFFEVTSEPLPRDELTEPGAKSGCRVIVTVKPGLPLGPFRQTIRLAVAAGDQAEPTNISLRVEGAVVSDFSIVGRGWQSSDGLLTIGSVNGEKGTARELALLVRGVNRHEVEFEVRKLEPSWLQVSLGQPEELSDSVVKIPLTVTIPPGRPPSIHLGTDQGPYGQIVLGVKDPGDDRELRMYVKFVIYDSQSGRN